MCLIEELISQGALLDLRIKEELLGSVRVGQHSVQCLSESGVQDPERGQWHKRQDHNSDFERANFGLFRDLLVRWLPGFQRSPASAEKVYPKHREQERGTLFSLELTDRVREKTQTEIQIPPEHKKTFFFLYCGSAQKQLSCAERWWNLIPWRYSKPNLDTILGNLH